MIRNPLVRLAIGLFAGVLIIGVALNDVLNGKASTNTWVSNGVLIFIIVCGVMTILHELWRFRNSQS